MKKMSKVVAATILMLGCSTVWADRGDQYVLGKFGFMSVDLNDADPLFSLGALYGYGITPEITVEGELNLGLIGGEYKQKNAQGQTFEKGDYRIWTLAGYGVYRFPLSDVAYLKGKLGLLYENVKRSGDLIGGDTSNGFGLAGGIGAGTQVIKGLTAEAEITGIDQDIIFYSLGLHYAF